MRFFFTHLLLFLPFFVWGQKASIEGEIFDADKSPLPSITIKLDGTAFGTSTDNAGNFSISDIPEGSYVIVASGVGYEVKSASLTIQSGKTTYIQLQLNEGETALEEVVVEALSLPRESQSVTRTSTPLIEVPQQVQVVDRATIEDQQLFTMDQALKNVAGINVSGSNGAMNIRGFGTNASNTLINGMKGTPYPAGVMPLLANVESVEVIHGPSAVLYGEGSLGGRINLVTKQPKKETHANVSIGGGNYGLFRAMGDVTGKLNPSESLYFLVGAAYQTGGRVTDNFDNENFQLYGSLKWEASDKTNLQLNANFNLDRATSNWAPEIPVLDGLPVFSLPDEFNFQAEDAFYDGNSYQLQLLADHELNANWKANLLFGISQSKAERNQYGLSWTFDQETGDLGRDYTEQEVVSPTTTVNPYVEGKFNIGRIKNKLAAGVDLTLSRSNYPNGIKYFSSLPLNIYAPDYSSGKTGDYLGYSSRTEKFTYNTVGVYLQDQLTLSKKLKALFGIRYTNYYMRYFADDDQGNALYDEQPENTEAITPSLGLVYQAREHTSFYVDYSKGFVPQYSNERKFGGPFDPEITHQYELGYKGEYAKNRLHTTLAVYHITKQNVLVYYDDPELPDGYGYRPLEEVQSKGIEVGVSGYLTDRLYLIANYSFNNTEVSESNTPENEGNTFYNSPENLANGWVKYALLKGEGITSTIGMGVNYVDERTTYFGDLPDYTVADAMLSIGFKRYKLQLNVNNLFDEQYAISGGYVDYLPGMGRNFLLTAKWSY
ncbi:TonB-dependent receptor [Echinicola rosea]|uniref:Ferrichrome-iron receptor n=1 Tax=Echinicola rosea TaxID=1807691 RepID=A0ABQ1V9K7_9BACT|nr:TonB-dependent receptor [Echinicola rosea]GGF44474.1 ferrichrome-iron receptor [Echinicola rosea]